MAKRLPPPPPRPVLWPLKPFESAKTTFEQLRDGRFRLTIEHDLVRGCPPEVLLWFFRQIGGTMQYGGGTYTRHLVWHPLDHIFWDLVRPSPKGDAGVGAQIRIVEAFQENPRYYVDTVADVLKLDETGNVDETRVAGITVMRLEHMWSPEGDGTRFASEMFIGATGALGKFALNPITRSRVFTEEMGPAWLQHNVEEVGNLENFVPDLYRERHGHEPGDEPR